MDPDNSAQPAPPSWRERFHLDRTTVPAAAVAAMAVVSVATAVMMSRQQHAHDLQARPAVAQARQVVTAPQQVVKAPPPNALGAGPGCRNCGVVESVASNRPSTFQMRVRMDDGSVRSIEQRAAFPAGQRVVVEGGTLKAATENG
jgi:hypothetical protein